MGDIARVTVYDVIYQFSLVEFRLYGMNYKGSIHISEFGKQGYGYIPRLSDIIHDGDQFNVALMEYDEKYSNWKLRLLPDDDNKSTIGSKVK